jgi:hypothetical protein
MYSYTRQRRNVRFRGQAGLRQRQLRICRSKMTRSGHTGIREPVLWNAPGACKLQCTRSISRSFWGAGPAPAANPEAERCAAISSLGSVKPYLVQFRGYRIWSSYCVTSPRIEGTRVDSILADCTRATINRPCNRFRLTQWTWRRKPELSHMQRIGLRCP